MMRPNGQDPAALRVRSLDLKVEMEGVDRLTLYSGNAKTHSKKQVSKLAASICQFGFVNSVLVDKDDQVIAGHGRLMAPSPSARAARTMPWAMPARPRPSSGSPASGKPRGRPRKKLDPYERLFAILNEEVSVTIGGEKKRITRNEMRLRALMKRALKGDLAASKEFDRQRRLFAGLIMAEPEQATRRTQGWW